MELKRDDTITLSQKRAWIYALESGEYKQTTGMMHNQRRTRHCCLGVLCNINAKRQRKGWEDDTYEFCTTLLGQEGESHCIRANDAYKLNFDDIALTLRGFWKIWD